MNYQQKNQNEKQKKRDTTSSGDSISIENFHDFVNNLNDKNQKNPNRINWDEYFMELAVLVSKRSPDAQTQHGAVIVDEKNRIVSTGYNGFPPGGPDHMMPNLRPEKYDFIIHAETNAILSSNQNLSDCKMYVTGMPCRVCFLNILGSCISRVVFGDISYEENEKDLLTKAYLYSLYDIELWSYDKNTQKNTRFSFHEDLHV